MLNSKPNSFINQEKKSLTQNPNLKVKIVNLNPKLQNWVRDWLYQNSLRLVDWRAILFVCEGYTKIMSSYPLIWGTWSQNTFQDLIKCIGLAQSKGLFV